MWLRQITFFLFTTKALLVLHLYHVMLCHVMKFDVILCHVTAERRFIFIEILWTHKMTKIKLV